MVRRRRRAKRRKAEQITTQGAPVRVFWPTCNHVNVAIVLLAVVAPATAVVAAVAADWPLVQE